MTNPYYNESILLRRKPNFYPEIPKPRFPGADEIISSQPQQQDQGSGFNWGALASGAAGLATNFAGMTNQGYQFDTNITPSDPSMMPSYGLGNLTSQIGNAEAKGASGGEILSGVGQGAMAGAEFGPLGAAAGGIIGGLGSIFAGGARRKRQRRQIRNAQQALRQGQTQFNEQSTAFQQKQNQLEDYQDRLNPQARLYNLYRNR